MGLNLNNLPDQIPSYPQRKPLLMIEECKQENAQVSKPCDRGIASPASLKCPRLQLPESRPLVDQQAIGSPANLPPQSPCYRTSFHNPVGLSRQSSKLSLGSPQQVQRLHRGGSLSGEYSLDLEQYPTPRRLEIANSIAQRSVNDNYLQFGI